MFVFLVVKNPPLLERYKVFDLLTFLSTFYRKVPFSQHFDFSQYVQNIRTNFMTLLLYSSLLKIRPLILYFTCEIFASKTKDTPRV